jgi:hypothetical protein
MSWIAFECFIENKEERCLVIPIFKKFRYYIMFSITVSTGHTGGLLDVDKELFLWSVITGKREFALLFWSRGKNKICKYNFTFFFI